MGHHSRRWITSKAKISLNYCHICENQFSTTTSHCQAIHIWWMRFQAIHIMKNQQKTKKKHDSHTRNQIPNSKLETKKPKKKANINNCTEICVWFFSFLSFSRKNVEHTFSVWKSLGIFLSGLEIETQFALVSGFISIIVIEMSCTLMQFVCVTFQRNCERVEKNHFFRKLFWFT